MSDAIQKQPPPPPPPPPPKVNPAGGADAAADRSVGGAPKVSQQSEQQRADAVAGASGVNAMRGEAAQKFLGTTGARSEEPSLPGADAVRQKLATEAAAKVPPASNAEGGDNKPSDKPAEDSAAWRFGKGLVSGVKNGAVGIWEGAKALVTDPVGTAEAAGTAIKKGADATEQYAKDLYNKPGETIDKTVDAAKDLGDKIANAKAEDWGNFIGENAVGAVGGYGAGKALQGVKALRAVNAVSKATPDAVPDAKPPVKAPDAKPDAKPLEAKPDPAAAEGTPGRNLLTDPKQVDPLAKPKLTEKGAHAPVELTKAEGQAINKFRDATIAHNDKFNLDKDLPPSANTGRDLARQTNDANVKSLGHIHAQIRRTDEAVANHLKPDDLAGRLKEQRGVDTKFDHVKETQGAYENLKGSVARIDKFLADNPNLPESQSRYLLSRRNGHAGLIRSLENDLGFK